MSYLLDVNALIALGFADHEFHPRLVEWLLPLRRVRLLTCPTTEMGFVRILAQMPGSLYSVAEARTLLLRLKVAPGWPLELLPDDGDIASLPPWVAGPKQVTDGHLLALASTHHAQLATFDARIPGAFLIP